MDPQQPPKIPVDSDGRPLLVMIRIAANREKLIPEAYRSLVPSKEISISSLLNSSLPTIASTASLLRPAKLCLVTEPPSWTEDQLKTTRVPSKEWLAALDTAIVEDWLKGVRSIEHPSDTTIRFPLWVGTFWEAISKVIQEQREWRRAQEWMFTLTQGQETRKAQDVLDRIPCGIYIWMLPVEADRVVTKVSFFAQLLSDGFLVERHIDMFVSYLNILARRRPNPPKVLAVDLPLSHALLAHHNATTDKVKRCTLLLQYAAVFKGNTAYHSLLFPAHVGGTKDGHWVVFCVNFANREYSFGELYRSHADNSSTDLSPWSVQEIR